MGTVIRSLNNWPRTKGGDPIFSDSGDAVFYAHLIINDQVERLRIARLKERVHYHLKILRGQDNPNYTRMMELAVKGQFYRECLEEIERIEKEGKG